MKKPIKIIAAIIAIVFAFGQMAYPAPHSALRPIATAERKKAIFEEEAIPAVSAAILSISEFSELREALTKGAKEADLRELEEKIIEKAILAAKAQIECDAKIARLHYDVIELGKRRQTRIVQSDRPVDTKDMLTPQLLRKIKQAAADEGIDLCIDTHLMIMNTSEECIQDYIKAGSDYIILHWEGFRDKDLLAERLNFIRDKGCRAGLSCNPRESMKKITEFLARADVKDKLDIFQQMTTYSGRGGQKFIARTLLRIHKLREILPEDVLIQADGGIDPLYSAEQALKAGADIIVSGYAFFGETEQSLEVFKANYRGLLTAMKNAMDELRAKSWGRVREEETSKFYAAQTALKIIRQLLREREDKKRPLVVGFGSGTTARNWFFPLIREAIIYGQIKEGDIVCISSIELTDEIFDRCGMLGKIEDYPEIDIMVFGADQIDRDFYTKKGSSGVFLDERKIADKANKTVLIVYESKLVPYLDGYLPIEVKEEDVGEVVAKLNPLGAMGWSPIQTGGEIFRPRNRRDRVIIDVNFGGIANPAKLAADLEDIPGVISHSIFFTDSPPDYVIAGNEYGSGGIRSIKARRHREGLGTIEDYTVPFGRGGQEAGSRYEQTQNIKKRDDMAKYSKIMSEVAHAYRVYCRELTAEEQMGMLVAYFFIHLISFAVDEVEKSEERHKVTLHALETLLRDKWPHVRLSVLEPMLVYMAQYEKAHRDDLFNRLLQPILKTEHAPGFMQAMVKVLSRASKDEIFKGESLDRAQLTDVDIQGVIIEIIEMASDRNPDLRNIIKRAYNVASFEGELEEVPAKFIDRLKAIFTEKTPSVDVMERQEMAEKSIAEAA